MADANEVIAPRIGLPDLPVVDFSKDERPEHGLHWKDEPSHPARRRPPVRLARRRDHRHRSATGPHPSRDTGLLHRVDPLVGPTETGFSVIRQWLTAEQQGLDS